MEDMHLQLQETYDRGYRDGHKDGEAQAMENAPYSYAADKLAEREARD